MAVLPWGHNRNQTSGDTEKSKGSSLDWFSRVTAEPSRQAINQLMKQHSRTGSGGSANLRVRSRADTPTSQKSQSRSATPGELTVEPRSSAHAEKSTASHSRPTTPARPSTPARPNTPGLERSDSTSKPLFQKGGLLRRQGSKMGFNTSPANGVVSPPRPSSSRAGLRGMDYLTSPSKTDRRPSLSISNPFDFAHIMHGDISAFTGLGRIDESDLASQFDAIQARYRTTNHLGEPISLEPQSRTSAATAGTGAIIEEVTALPQNASFMAPCTPPPVPLPKNSPPLGLRSPVDIRTSRSAENFSRPNPRSPTRPSSCHLQKMMSSVPSDTTESTVVKPLPQLPTMIHAVSTEDDTARPLISAPLPTPPVTEQGISRHHRKSSSRSSLRHMSTYPSSRHPQFCGSVSDGQLLNIKEEDGPARPHSDYELSQHNHYRCSSKREPVVPKQTEVEDWEVAIDSAWDLENEDLDDENQMSSDIDVATRHASVHSKAGESLLIVEQPQQEQASLPSTPLMMAPLRPSQSGTGTDIPLTGAETIGDGTLTKEHAAALVGLGIDSKLIDAPSRVSQPPVLEVITNDGNHTNGSPRLTRSAYSAISHSSSQESIILSIASSILSTQRSSVSSVSVSDYPHAGKSDRSSIAASANSPLLNVTTQKAARPDSSCLPSALLKQMNHEAQKTARPDSTCLPPSIPSSQRNSVIFKAERPESICLSKEMLATFPMPDTKPRPGAVANRKSRGSVTKRVEDGVGESCPDDILRRATHGSRGSVSRGVPSISGGDGVITSRQRSSTQNSKGRPARVSYSLFPTAGHSVPAASNLDIDAVGS